MSLPEVKLWGELRRRPGGLRFRRQHPIGPYVLDFYCASAKLAVEVDGLAHDMGDRPERDRRRDEWLREQGITTLRLPAAEVLRDVGSVVQHIVRVCSMPLHHQPAAGGPPPQ